MIQFNSAFVFHLPVCSYITSAPHHTDNLKTKAPNTTGSNHLYNTLELLMMGIVVPETCWASNKISNKNHLLHLVGILLPHINDDAWSKPHQIYVGLLTYKSYSNNTRTEEDLKQSSRKTVLLISPEELPCALSRATVVCDPRCEPKKSISSAFLK